MRRPDGMARHLHFLEVTMQAVCELRVVRCEPGEFAIFPEHLIRLGKMLTHS